jgi:hypothetical protein
MFDLQSLMSEQSLDLEPCKTDLVTRDPIHPHPFSAKSSGKPSNFDVAVAIGEQFYEHTIAAG